MALDINDTVHITFARKIISPNPPDTIIEPHIILYYGKFHILNPEGLIPEYVSSWKPENFLEPIDPLGAGIALGYASQPHLAWVENGEGKYGVKSGGGWITIKVPPEGAVLIDPESMKDELRSQIDYKYCVNLGWTDGEIAMHEMFYAGDTIKILKDTIFIGQGIKNLGVYGSIATFERDGNIFVSLYNPIEREWSEPETLESTPSLPPIPVSYHLCSMQTLRVISQLSDLCNGPRKGRTLYTS